MGFYIGIILWPLLTTKVFIQDPSPSGLPEMLTVAHILAIVTIKGSGGHGESNQRHTHHGSNSRPHEHPHTLRLLPPISTISGNVQELHYVAIM